MQIINKLRLRLSPRAWQIMITELLGTLMLAFVLGSLLIQVTTTGGTDGPVNPLGAFFSPFILGLAIAFLILVLGKYTAAHFNPAVTIAVFLSGKISIARAFALIVAQLVGGAVGIASVKLIFSHSSYSYPTYNSILQSVTSINLSSTHIALFEVIGAFLLTLGTLAAIQNSKNSEQSNAAMVAVAFTIATWISQPFSMGIINPSFSLALGMPPIYLFAPCLGAVVAVTVATSYDSLTKIKLQIKTGKKK